MEIDTDDANEQILAALRQKLRPSTEEEENGMSVSEMVEKKKAIKGMLLNKLKACLASLPTPDSTIVQQIDVFAELQVPRKVSITDINHVLTSQLHYIQLELFREEACLRMVKDILRTSKYSKSLKFQSGDLAAFPLQSLCAHIIYELYKVE